MAVGGPGCWSALRLLSLPVRPAFEFLGATSVGCLLSDAAIDLVVFANDLATLGLGDDASVCVAQPVVLTGAPAGADPGEQDGGEVTQGGVVVSVGVHQPDVFGGELGVGLAGLVGRGPQGFAQKRVAGLGQPVLVAGLASIYLWRDPHGRCYLVDHTGSRKLGKTGSGTGLPDIAIDIVSPTPGAEHRYTRTHVA